MSGTRRSLIDPFRFAARGVLAEAVSQRNMRLHLVAAVLVATFGSAFPLGIAEQLALLSSVFLVLAAEVLNTALEAAVDLAGSRPGERARLAKDAAAGALALGLSLAAFSACLVFPFRRPRLLDWLAALGGAALVLPLALVSKSLVFTGVAGLALAVCAWAAFARGSAAVEEGAAFRVGSPVDGEPPDAISRAAPPPRRPAR